MANSISSRWTMPGWRWLALLGVMAAILTALVALPDRNGKPLQRVKTWTYQLQGLDDGVSALARTAGDMLVVDYAKGGASGMVPLTREEVAQLKRKPEGGRRLVLAYFSVGEAEEYRPYWQAEWTSNRPDWLLSENCRWPKNHLVRFWDEGWRRIIFDSPQSYLARIQEAGFDGVYLDRVDVYGDLAPRFPEARTRMLTFVGDLAVAARAKAPRFLVIVQNAEELLDEASYRRAIDAVAKEDLLYGVEGTGKRNPEAMIAGSIELLNKLRADGKPVFAVEYLKRESDVAAATAELEERGIVPVFPSRALDGTDPLAPETSKDQSAEKETANAQETGTPEYASTNCNGVWPKPPVPRPRGD